MIFLPVDDIENIKKRNRIKKLSPKVHKIAHESGRGTKNLWRKILGKI
jgi:hypothetical protein